MITKRLIRKYITEAFEETKEATGTGSAGGYTAPLFGDMEEEEIEEDEFFEATSSSSSGSYETPAFLAKDLNNWRTSKKTQIPGGTFVSVKDKCKTFPYCNQGIGALNFSKNKSDAIKKMTKRKPKKSKINEDIELSIKIKKAILSFINGNL
jgi:hypothetical protein